MAVVLLLRSKLSCTPPPRASLGRTTPGLARTRSARVEYEQHEFTDLVLQRCDSLFELEDTLLVHHPLTHSHGKISNVLFNIVSL